MLNSITMLKINDNYFFVIFKRGSFLARFKEYFLAVSQSDSQKMTRAKIKKPLDFFYFFSLLNPLSIFSLLTILDFIAFFAFLASLASLAFLAFLASLAF